MTNEFHRIDSYLTIDPPNASAYLKHRIMLADALNKRMR